MTDIDAPTIAGFEVLKKLGQGGMSTVWMARQLSLDRIVAVKVLLPRFALDEEEVARFQSEAQAAARLKHGGIVQVYDTSVTDGSYYFIMEYIAGYTVGDWVRRKGVLPERDALLVAEHVSDALAYAWEHAKIIHCDIKPDNVMIDEDGTVKVTDLGLARTLNAMSSFTEDDGYVLGTPAYMSPEQARGDAHLDFRSDIYSLGAMLYHLVTGKRLFYESNDSETLELQIVGTAPDAMELNPSLSRPTCAMIERMLAKNPDVRGESWQAVHADIRRAYSGIMPHHNLHADDRSTMECCEQRTEIEHNRLKRLTSGVPRKRSAAVWTALWASIAAVAIAVAVKVYISLSMQTLPNPVPARNPSQPSGNNTPKESRNFREQAIETLRQQLTSLKDAGDYTRAEALVAAYPGNRPKDIAFRKRMMREINHHREARESEQRQEERRRQQQLANDVMTPIMKNAARAIIQGNLEQALDLIRPLRTRDDLSWYHDSLKELQEGLEALQNADEHILETFRMQQGQTIEVELDSGAALLTIGEIENGQLQCFQHSEMGDLQEITISAQDLSQSERTMRLSMEHHSIAAIANGVAAYHLGNVEEAARSFRDAHFLIADALTALAESNR